jgi:hypothetical protein
MAQAFPPAFSPFFRKEKETQPILLGVKTGAGISCSGLFIVINRLKWDINTIIPQ